MTLGALPMEKVWVDAHTTTPQAICRRRWRGQGILLQIDVSLYILFDNVPGLFVTGEVYTNRDDGLEALGTGHVGDAWVGLFARRMENQHAEADEGMAEEDCDGEKDHDKEDVDLLADVAVCQSDCKVCEIMLEYIEQTSVS
jgi:hypothetical protein